MTNQDFENGRRPVDYQENPNFRRRDKDGGRSYLGWIVGAALVLALIVGVFAFNGNNTTNTASNPAASGTVNSSSTNASTPPAPATTGSGGASTPAPAR